MGGSSVFIHRVLAAYLQYIDSPVIHVNMHVIRIVIWVDHQYLHIVYWLPMGSTDNIILPRFVSTTSRNK
jgi:hypothetical protein